jgi:hypothetical protein
LAAYRKSDGLASHQRAEHEERCSSRGQEMGQGTAKTKRQTGTAAQFKSKHKGGYRVHRDRHHRHESA